MKPNTSPTTKTIALIDYGAGNVRSVHKALEAVGARVALARDPGPLADAGKVVLPGVGAFGDCMQALERTGLAGALLRAIEEGKPMLGICVGMQVLFQVGEEMGAHDGLGLMEGRVVRFDDGLSARGLKVPHTGWNQVEPSREHVLFRGLPDGSFAYFNHAYHCQALPEHVLATTDYGGRFTSVVNRDRVFGIQFHPEKSQDVGLRILTNFVEHVE